LRWVFFFSATERSKPAKKKGAGRQPRATEKFHLAEAREFSYGTYQTFAWLFSLQSAGQIQAFSEYNAMHLLDDGQGLLIGYSSKEIPEPLLLEIMRRSSMKLLEHATEEELLLMQSRAILENEIIPQNWHIKYFDGEVSHLLVVAIDKSLKGTGGFQKTINAVILSCERRRCRL
jgi:hypothetical protein